MVSSLGVKLKKMASSYQRPQACDCCAMIWSVVLEIPKERWSCDREPPKFAFSPLFASGAPVTCCDSFSNKLCRKKSWFVGLEFWIFRPDYFGFGQSKNFDSLGDDLWQVLLEQSSIGLSLEWLKSWFSAMLSLSVFFENWRASVLRISFINWQVR